MAEDATSVVKDAASLAEAPASVVEARASTAKAPVSVVIVTNLEKAEHLATVAGRTPYAEALAQFTVDAVFLAKLIADVAECRSLLGLAVERHSQRQVVTQTESDAKTALLTLLQRVQSAALIESAGRSTPGWYIGTNLSVQSRGMLETIAVALADKLETHVPPGLPADIATQLRTALATWSGADDTQGATLITAKQKRAAAMTLYATINDRRIQLLLAADAAYPAREKTNAPIRADFGLPKTRPYRPKR